MDTCQSSAHQWVCLCPVHKLVSESQLNVPPQVLITLAEIAFTVPFENHTKPENESQIILCNTLVTPP